MQPYEQSIDDERFEDAIQEVWCEKDKNLESKTTLLEDGMTLGMVLACST